MIKAIIPQSKTILRFVNASTLPAFFARCDKCAFLSLGSCAKPRVLGCLGGFWEDTNVKTTLSSFLVWSDDDSSCDYCIKGLAGKE